MKRYILKKTLLGAIVIIFIVAVNFFLIHAAPGDPISILAGQDRPSKQMIMDLKHQYGLDKPVYMQFLYYVKNLAEGDLGKSIIYNQPVINVIMDRMGATALLVLSSAILSVFIGTALGIFAARKNGSKIDVFLCNFSYLLDSMPAFWLGLMLILIFASGLKLLPTSGMVNLRETLTGFNHIMDVLKHLILPAGTLTIVQIPYYFRISRSSVLQVVSEDFITTFRAAGMDEKRIFNKYVFKNAILPTITVFGINLAYIVTGAAIIEIVFAWPGAGRLMLSAIMQRDYPTLMGIYLILSVMVAVTRIIIDIIYAYIDPRIRYE